MCLASDKIHHDLSAAKVYLIFPPMLLNWSLQEKGAYIVVLEWGEGGGGDKGTIQSNVGNSD